MTVNKQNHRPATNGGRVDADTETLPKPKSNTPRRIKNHIHINWRDIQAGRTEIVRTLCGKTWRNKPSTWFGNRNDPLPRNHERCRDCEDFLSLQGMLLQVEHSAMRGMIEDLTNHND
ncbi:hypothetical protein QP921_05600 [Corynebacterium pseudodiphtheriticum]|uniref:hypothetical protein n=1 Tax=Corynebacterium pseudodiphtheriticum TaxID=37637 RepID=UPI00254DE836|nr:hypothetical protein [Corynebacterium pseudodiphtheriticum]MDK8577857.1 hypothetical protein [Corynebacterium pseudodiphtheriticum]MDK8761221.1 hypothetical protein [Corynebacterium pseudodiphtheriticum]